MMSEAQKGGSTIDGEYLESRERFQSEFEKFKKTLSGDKQKSNYLWEEFILQRENDGTETFEFLVGDLLNADEDQIIKLVEGGKVKEAESLGKYTKQLREKLSEIQGEAVKPSGRYNVR